jgi:tRNA dimethylallyltransferase
MAGLPVIVFTGPTGSGKSRIAPLVAKRIGAEIICADSRQVFSGIPVGAAAPDPAEMAGIPHHLYGILDPSEECSAGRFRDLAEGEIASIRGRGKIPMLVGGTGLYIEAVTGGLGLAPPAGPETVKKLQNRADSGGIGALWGELSAKDPVSAGKIHPTDAFRIIRALSVLEETGRPFSSFTVPITPRHSPVARIAISWPREELYTRINLRCDAMLRHGMMEEAAALRARGLSPDLPALRSIGYHHLFAVIDGRMKPDQALELIKRDSRRYAKRQMTWLRGRGGDIFWAPGGDPETAAEGLSKHCESVIF